MFSIFSQIVDLILPAPAITANVHSMFFEVTAGVGGQEAMLFAAEMIAMYEGFIEFNGWQKDVTEIDKSDIGEFKFNFAIYYGFSKNH